MVIGSSEKCNTCGKSITKELEHVWVRADFYTGKILEGYRQEIPECYDISFCSLKCMREYDWTKLKTKDNWRRAHAKEDYENIFGNRK